MSPVVPTAATGSRRSNVVILTTEGLFATTVSVPATSVTTAAVDALRSARRTRRLGDVAWGDLAYRVYTTALGALVLTVFASGLVGDRRLDAAQTAEVIARGPRWIGLGAALLMLFGVRSGLRGGPLALEAADVHHLLLAPVDRGRVLRRPAVSTIAYSVAALTAIGALSGELLSQRLDGSAIGWILSGALCAATLTVLTLGSAMVAESRRLPRLVAPGVAMVLVLWAAAAVWRQDVPSPTSSVGEIAFWPASFSVLGIVAIIVAVALAVFAVASIGGLDMEAAQRRTQLVGQLRFAVTQQDLRSVLLLRRQLASEVPRRRPWISHVPAWFGRRAPVAARDLQSMFRWPLTRVLRVVILVLAAAFALRAAYAGNTPLILLAGILTFVAGLDVIEPLAQEIDHPTLVASYPMDPGELRTKHLTVPILTMTLLGILSTAVVWAVSPAPDVWLIGLITSVSGGAGAVAAAASSVLGEDPSSGGASFSTPEVAGPRFVIRTLWPPFVAVVGLVPVLVAQRLARNGSNLMPSTAVAACFALALAGIVFAWVRSRDELRASMSEAFGGNDQRRSA